MVSAPRSSRPRPRCCTTPLPGLSASAATASLLVSSRSISSKKKRAARVSRPNTHFFWQKGIEVQQMCLQNRTRSHRPR